MYVIRMIEIFILFCVPPRRQGSNSSHDRSSVPSDKSPNRLLSHWHFLLICNRQTNIVQNNVTFLPSTII